MGSRRPSTSSVASEATGSTDFTPREAETFTRNSPDFLSPRNSQGSEKSEETEKSEGSGASRERDSYFLDFFWGTRSSRASTPPPKPISEDDGALEELLKENFSSPVATRSTSSDGTEPLISGGSSAALLEERIAVIRNPEHQVAQKLNDLLERNPARLAGILIGFGREEGVRNALLGMLRIDSPQKAAGSALIATQLLREHEICALEQENSTHNSPEEKNSSLYKTNQLSSTIRKLLDSAEEEQKTQYMAEAIHGLYQKGELTFGIVGILMGELHFPTSMKLADGEKTIVPKKIVTVTSISSQVTEGSIDAEDVQAIAKNATADNCGILSQDALLREDPNYRIFIGTYSNLLLTEVGAYNKEVQKINGGDPEKGCIDPNSPTFTDELAKITPAFLEKLKNAPSEEERDELFEDQGWEPRDENPGLLSREEGRPENYKQLIIGDFMYRHLRNALRKSITEEAERAK